MCMSVQLPGGAARIDDTGNSPASRTAPAIWWSWNRASCAICIGMPRATNGSSTSKARTARRCSAQRTARTFDHDTGDVGYVPFVMGQLRREHRDHAFVVSGGVPQRLVCRRIAEPTDETDAQQTDRVASGHPAISVGGVGGRQEAVTAKTGRCRETECTCGSSINQWPCITKIRA